MCLNHDVEYNSSNESINNLQNRDLDWPIKGKNQHKLIVACNICYYPITFEEHIVDEIRNENNSSFGIVIPMVKLFKKVKIFGDNPLESWRTEIYCPNCGIILSFLDAHKNYLAESNFEKIQHYINFGEQIVILWIYPLYRGAAIEAKTRFEQIDEF